MFALTITITQKWKTFAFMYVLYGENRYYPVVYIFRNHITVFEALVAQNQERIL